MNSKIENGDAFGNAFEETHDKSISLKVIPVYSRKEREYMRFVDTCLSEEDFWQPADERHIETYIEDIEGGDNFVDYCTEMFELFEEEEYFD